MKAPDKIWVREFAEGVNQMWSHIKATKTSAIAQHEYIRKDALLEMVKLAYGKVSMNPFDCSEAFEELIGKIESL